MNNLPTIKEIEEDVSNTQARHKLREKGWIRCPFVKWDNEEYLMISYNYPRPGRNTAAVIRPEAYNGKFKLFHFKTSPWLEEEEGYILYADEGWAVMTIYEGELCKLRNPMDAILTYRIVEPTKEDLTETREYQ